MRTVGLIPTTQQSNPVIGRWPNSLLRVKSQRNHGSGRKRVSLDPLNKSNILLLNCMILNDSVYCKNRNFQNRILTDQSIFFFFYFILVRIIFVLLTK